MFKMRTADLTDIGVPVAAYRAVGVDPGRLFAAGPVVHVEYQDMAWESIAEPGTALQ